MPTDDLKRRVASPTDAPREARGGASTPDESASLARRATMPSLPARVRLLASANISTHSGILRFRRDQVVDDPTLLHLVRAHNIAHEAC